ncbi:MULTISPECIES: DNA cytosine methyltransferase [Nostocales]|uniref:DNA cytosine methyltransferase n=1 Tax=Nostocales TaxID=1161 RepID=UPI0009079F9F
MAQRRTKRRSEPTTDSGDTTGARKLTLYDFCSGIGLGFPAASVFLGGFEIVGLCEIDGYCRDILSKRYPGVPIARDIRVREDFTGIKPRIITASPNCQPFSLNGKRRGADDERNLFPALFDIIRSSKPEYLCLENVAGILSCPYKSGGTTGGFFKWILWQFSCCGYYVQWQTLNSAVFGAPFPRERLVLVAIAASVVEQFGGNPPAWAEQVGSAVERVGATWPARSSEPGVSSERLVQLASELGESIGVPSGNGDIRNQRKAYGNCFDPRPAAVALSYILRVEEARRKVEEQKAS